MDTKFRVRYYTHKAMLTFMGPADLDNKQDPMQRLEDEWEKRFGRRVRQARTHIPKRRFRPGT